MVNILKTALYQLKVIYLGKQSQTFNLLYTMYLSTIILNLYIFFYFIFFAPQENLATEIKKIPPIKWLRDCQNMSLINQWHCYIQRKLRQTDNKVVPRRLQSEYYELLRIHQLAIHSSVGMVLPNQDHGVHGKLFFVYRSAFTQIQ